MKIYFISLFTLFLTQISGELLCQTPSNQDRIDNLKTIIPPSPNSSSLAKYAEWPINLYTGLPSIDIPIYELKENGISLPISLSYHAGGNKVGEVASWVGLGWSLNAGGVITRSIRGLPDEAPEVGSFAKESLYSNPDSLCSVPNNAAEGTIHRVQSAKGLHDSEQDSYSISALGKSFKFIIQHNGAMVSTKYNKIKIESNIKAPNAVSLETYWNVILEDGTKLEFGGATNYIERSDFTKMDVGYFQVPTSWMLRKIISPNGKVVNFSYSSSVIKQDNQISESDYLKYSLLAFDPSGLCQLYPNPDSHQRIKANRQDVLTLQLATIESDLTRVEFALSANGRLDLVGAKSLHKVKVYSKLEAKYIHIFNLNQAYSSAVSSVEYNGQALANEVPSFSKRLKLSGIEKRDANENIENTWLFEYNPLSLPSRRSFAQDHWGFYNGKTQSNTFLPKYNYPIPATITVDYPHAGFNPPVFTLGVNRDGDANFLEAEILKKITYPTGGKSEFIYEANSIQVNEEQFVPASKTVQLNLNAQSNPFTTIDEKQFSITVPQNVLLNFNSYISPAIFNDRPNSKVTATILNPSGVSVGGAVSTGEITNILVYKFLNTPGTYTLRISTNILQEDLQQNDIVTGNANLSYEESTGFQLISKCTGGLHLKKTIQTDGVDPSKNMEKTFVYENPLIISPVDIGQMYFTETEEYLCPTQDPHPSSSYNCHYKVITRNSSTKFSLGTVQGGSVGYGKVTVLNGANGVNGKTISEFTNEQDANMILAMTFPYPPTDSRDWRRGQLVRQQDFNNINVLLKEVNNNYQYLFKFSYGSFKSGIYLKYHTNSDICAVGSCSDPFDNCGVQTVCYNTSSEQVNLVSTTEKVFDQNGLNPLITSTSYFYDNPDNVNPVRTETTNSKGELLKTITRTPLEKADINNVTPLTATAAAAIDTMLARNIISPAIQTESFKGTMLLSRSLANYKNWNSTITQVENVQVQKGVNPIETRLTINGYDTQGNLMEQQKTSDIKQSYIYDYLNTYPVAQAINAPQTDIAATSFEADGKGNWTFTGIPSPDVTAPTGKKSYNLANGNISKTVTPNGSYVISMWKSATATITVSNSILLKTGFTINDWTYVEYLLQDQNVSTVTISGAGNIDELRLYPKDAQMTTYTYEPLIGLTTQCDVNNNITYYEYDAFGRLKTIRDKDKNILKAFDYKYQQ